MDEEELNRPSVAFIVGRFQPFHLGHQAMADLAYSQCDRVVVLVGSSQAGGTNENPFSFETRKQAIQAIFPKAIVLPLPDIGVGDVPAWGDYLFRTIRQAGYEPAIFVTGVESRRYHWFNEENAPALKTVSLERSILPISGTEVRSLMFSNDPSWKKWVDPRAVPIYEEALALLKK